MVAKEKTIEASVVIRKPREEVFGFYRDFRNLPRFLGDVMAVEQVDPTDSRWTIHGSGPLCVIDLASSGCVARVS